MDKDAKTERAERNALLKLTPNSIDIKIDGQDVRVAGNKEENAALNMIMAAQGRALIQRALKKWQDMDEVPSPKELRDVAGAMRDIAQFSAEIYSGSDDPLGKGGKKEDEKQVAEVDFSKLVKKPIEVQTKQADGQEGTTPKGGGSVGSIQGQATSGKS